ncbi:unnamed protein product [Lactuca virosa]|uniref:Uncharacterized protein n=1 Tax=Lactuca virosa TaxID=75947 RepID=A0AAU9MR53_9ASTR|nr:unnamed protein product [Lactuca virosa]
MKEVYRKPWYLSDQSHCSIVHVNFDWGISPVTNPVSDSEDGPAHPNIIYEEPDDEASSSDKDVSDATLPAIKTLSIYLFFGGFGQEGQKRDSISQKQIPPPMLLRSAYRGIERKDPGPEQVGLGYRAVSAVGVTKDVLVRFI